MNARFYTLMVVSHQGRRTRALALSRRFVVSLALIGLLLAGAGMLAPRWYLERLQQRERLAGMRLENTALRGSVSTFGNQVRDLRERIDYYEQQARKLALLAGLDGEASRSSGRTDAVLEELGALTGREERLTRNYEALDRAYKKRQAYLQAVPSLSPVQEGYFGSSYGWRRDPFTGRRAFHRGQDIVARRGTEVVAAADGKVVRTGRNGGLGLAVVLSHGHGLISRYGHLSRIKVHRGQRIKRGELIGYVGSTGRSTGSHLHYEVIRNGKQVDPRDYILEAPRVPLA
ncbi:MAG: M23 family metallopeptidase [Acidobacteriota bacterium]